MTEGDLRYQSMFARLDTAGEGAVGAFVMLGDPDLATSAKILDALVEGGADMIEVGIPFSDPIADGPVIQAAGERALRQGVRPADCFEMLTAFRSRHPQIPVGVLTYANLVIARGRDAFYSRCRAAGVDSVLVADVPLIEAKPFVASAKMHGVAPVMIAAATTPAQALASIARLSEGYTYCVTRAGVTGAGSELRLDHAAMLELLKKEDAPPPVFGFGISEAGHVRQALATGALGVIIGSAIVKLIAAERDPAPSLRAYLKVMKQASRRS